MDQLQAFVPLAIAVWVVWRLAKKRTQAQAARADAASLAKGGAAGARADVGGIALHLHFGPQYGADNHASDARYHDELGGDDYQFGEHDASADYDELVNDQHYFVPIEGSERRRSLSHAPRTGGTSGRGGDGVGRARRRAGLADGYDES